MAIGAKVTLEGNAALRIREIEGMLKRPEAMWKELGRRAAIELRKWFVARDGEPNKLAPGRREHFWAQIRDAVGNPEIFEGGAAVTIADSRYALKVFGGTVVPREAKALAIPMHALAYARRPAVFEDETGHDLFRPKGKRVLMAEIGENGAPVVIYLLAKSATVPPDPKALPDPGILESACLDQAERHLARALQSGGTIGQI